MNRGVLIPCPRGTYRIGSSEPTGTMNCTRCPRGWTTTSISSMVVADCNELQPGFYGTNSSVAATACPKGTYWPGGSNTGVCTPCPAGLTTRNITVDNDGLVGAKSQSECGEWGTGGVTKVLQSKPWDKWVGSIVLCIDYQARQLNAYSRARPTTHAGLCIVPCELYCGLSFICSILASGQLLTM